MVEGLEDALLEGEEGLPMVQECLAAILQCLSLSGGLLRQFILDDKVPLPLPLPLPRLLLLPLLLILPLILKLVQMLMLTLITTGDGRDLDFRFAKQLV